MTRTFLAAAALALATAGCTAVPGWHTGDSRSPPQAGAPARAQSLPTKSDVATLRALIRFARSWELTPRGRHFGARVGPFSALELLAGRNRPLASSLGPHRHCASPPVAPPREIASLRRISVQPRKIESCLQWFTVDAFVTRNGEIRAITLDLWEP